MKLLDAENDKVILSLKTEVRKLKETEASEINRGSFGTSSFSGQNNLKKQLKMTSDFPGIFSYRFSNIRNTISKLKAMPSFKEDENKEFFGIKEEIKEEPENNNIKGAQNIQVQEKNYGKIKEPTAPIEYKYLSWNEARFIKKTKNL